MKVPEIAKKSFDELSKNPNYMGIVQHILQKIKKIPSAIKRAKFIHNSINQYNESVFSNPIVKELSPCKSGCTACCHTQISITQDEAELLAQKIHEGLDVNLDLLRIQAQVGDNSIEFYKLGYEDRRCIFLDEVGFCKVYSDRPSVCRTNAVLGEPDQCDTSVELKPLRLVKTPESDMVIFAAYLHAKDCGSLPSMVNKILLDKRVLNVINS